jgi:hypothetical protein
VRRAGNDPIRDRLPYLGGQISRAGASHGARRPAPGSPAARGTFAATFFLAAPVALEVEGLRLERL